MSLDEQPTASGGPTDPETLQATIAGLEERLSALEAEADGDGEMVIISTKGSLDMAYPPLILASTAAAFGYDVTVFHTFWGLDILHEERSKQLQLSAVGNVSMPIPNVLAALPGMDRVTTWYMNRQMRTHDVASVEELIEVSLASGVELQACQMTIELFGYDPDDFYDGVTTGVGAASAFGRMQTADIQLLV
ncbi:MAG: DsrE/DsrF/DrsH-like family protein [Haloquadratum sp.]|jgi:peroxiredoxin family protein|nr:DsrE/DsrF/DrsH-like family protein [Haloferacaceae archaeon]MDR9445820.1 DsrE/DsrF/DrsH-like family protein [Haloquadratum sp.]